MVKKDNDNANQEYRDEALKDKVKSHNSSFANQLQTKAFKKDKRVSHQGGHLATEVNTTKIAKTNKDKSKNLSQIECYAYQQKGHYMNKYSKKSKN